MASLISQLRSGMTPQSNLSNAIAQTRNLMSQLQVMQNPQQAVLNAINSNPQLASLLKNSNGNWEQAARYLAASRGVDVDALVNELRK